MNELCVVSNEMNIPLRGLAPYELDLFWTIIAKIEGKGGNVIQLSRQEIVASSGYDMNHKTVKDFVMDMKSMGEKLMSLNTSIPDGNGGYKMFTLFPTYDPTPDGVTLQVHTRFQPWFNHLAKNFTVFELRNIVEFKSSYTKEIYRYLMKYRDTGYWVVTQEEFRKRFKIPASYRMSNIESVLKFAQEELLQENAQGVQPLKSLTYKVRKRGRKVTHIEFHFKATPHRIKEEMNEDITFELTPNKLVNPSPVSKTEARNKQIPFKKAKSCKIMTAEILEKLLEFESAEDVYDLYGSNGLRIEQMMDKFYELYVRGTSSEEIEFHKNKYRAMFGVLILSEYKQKIFDETLSQALQDLKSLKVKDPFGVYMAKEFELLESTNELIDDVEDSDDCEALYLKIKSNINKNNCKSYIPIIEEAFSLAKQFDDELFFDKIQLICEEYNIRIFN